MVERRPAPDLYAVLGVGTRASRDEVVRAYRHLAPTAHPDAQPDDPGASVRFRALTDAYDVLSDSAKRAEYDRTHLVDKPSVTGSGGSRRQPLQRPFPPSQRTEAFRSGEPVSPPPLVAGPVHIQPDTSRASGLRDGIPPEDSADELVAVLWRYVELPLKAWRL